MAYVYARRLPGYLLNNLAFCLGSVGCVVYLGQTTPQPAQNKPLHISLHVRCGIIFMVLKDKRHDSGGPGGGVGTSPLNQNVVPSRKRTVY